MVHAFNPRSWEAEVGLLSAKAYLKQTKRQTDLHRQRTGKFAKGPGSEKS